MKGLSPPIKIYPLMDNYVPPDQNFFCALCASPYFLSQPYLNHNPTQPNITEFGSDKKMTLDHHHPQPNFDKTTRTTIRTTKIRLTTTIRVKTTTKMSTPKTSPPSARVGAMIFMQQQNRKKKLHGNLLKTPFKLCLKFFCTTIDHFFKHP